MRIRWVQWTGVALILLVGCKKKYDGSLEDYSSWTFTETTVGGGAHFDGVDLIISVENRELLEGEQLRHLSTGMYTLINALIHPPSLPHEFRPELQCH